MIIKRKTYVERLISLKDVNTIKVITGIRRCGKTFLLFKLFYDRLIEGGVREDHILKYDLEDIENKDLRDNLALYNDIKTNIKDEEQYFVLIDEIQNIKDFFEVLNSLLHIDNVSAYVTGSNSKFLSKDIVTEFRGRSIETRVRPLSFREFVEGKGMNPRDCLEEYMNYGGMPELFKYDDPRNKTDYLKSLLMKVYFTDIVERNRVKNVPDLEIITDVLTSSVGSLNNILKITNTLRTKTGSKITYKTVKTYVDYLCEAFLFEKAARYDIKGRRYADSISKYFIADAGLKNARENFRENDKPHIMENIIYNELRIRGYDVDVGIVYATETEGYKRHKVNYEIDFVANKGNERIYVQSAYVVDDENRKRETRPFLKLNDSFKKVMIVKDHWLPGYDNDGVFWIGLIDFLTNENCF